MKRRTFLLACAASAGARLAVAQDSSGQKDTWRSHERPDLEGLFREADTQGTMVVDDIRQAPERLRIVKAIMRELK